MPHICVRWGATPDGVQLYEFPGAVPLARIAPRASVVPDLSEAIERLLADDPSDDAAVPALYEWRPEWGEPPPIGGAGAVRLERSAGYELVALADCPSPALLVINQAFDPGWSARVDGKPLRILRVNAVVQGVVVPPGFVAGRLPVSAPGLLAGGLHIGRGRTAAGRWMPLATQARPAARPAPAGVSEHRREAIFLTGSALAQRHPKG